MTEPTGPIVVSGVTAVAAIGIAAFTAPEWITIIGAVSALVIVVGGVLVNVIVAWKTRSAVDAVEKKADALTIVTAKVEGHVNSAETAYKSKIDALQRENLLLREFAAEKKETAAVLAQSVSAQVAAPVPVAVVNTPLPTTDDKGTP